MRAIFGTILHGLVGGDDEALRLFSLYRTRLEFALHCNNVDELPSYVALWHGLCGYLDAKKVLPPSAKAIADFVSLEVVAGSWLALQSSSIATAALSFAKEKFGAKPELDSLFEAYITVGRQTYQLEALKTAKTITIEVARYDADKHELTTGNKLGIAGVDAARIYLREQLARDKNAVSAKVLQGGWVENAEEIEQILLDKLDTSKRDRVYTGLAPIDTAMAIGPTEDIKYIGLLGFTNHGKSALLLPLIYNMARSGVNVLFVPLEFSVESAWLRLTWLHAAYFPHLQLCSLNTWTKTPHLVTQRDRESMAYIMADLKNRVSIKGGVDVIKVSTWAEVVEHVAANKTRWNYKVVAVDYMANFEVKGRDMIEEKKKVFREAQSLAQNWNGGQGMVVITPLQANKEGKKRAGDREGKDWGSYQDDLGATEWFTQAAQDMDAIWGVWSEGELKKANLIKISCVKSRTEFFDPFLIEISPKTRYFKVSQRNMIDAQFGMSGGDSGEGKRKSPKDSSAYYGTLAEQDIHQNVREF